MGGPASHIELMNELRIDLPDSARRCLPGSLLKGHVEWTFSRPPKEVLLELHCFTDGNFIGQYATVDVVRFDAPGIRERRPFELRIPAQPYSFIGTLFQIVWELELRGKPAKPAKAPLVVSPTGEPLKATRLDRVADAMLA